MWRSLMGGLGLVMGHHQTEEHLEVILELWVRNNGTFQFNECILNKIALL